MRTFIVIIACVGLAASAEFRSKIRARRQDVFTLSFGGGSGGGSSCTDTRSDCSQYEKSMCTDPKYQQWVQDNCCAFCQMGGTSAPSGGMINTGGSSSCTDKISNCAAYTQSVCTNPGYTQWVSENCPKFCNKCPSGSSSGTVYQPATLAPVISGSSSGSCADKISNCAAYTQSVCTNSDYAQWVSENCPRYCNRCSSSSGGSGSPTIFQPATYSPISPGGGSTCADKMNDCSSYGQSVCTNSQYAQWVTENCPKFCGKCGGSSGGSMPMSSGNTGGSSSCMDVSSNCAMLNQASHICTDAGAKIYAQQNCARTCNMCSSGGSSPMISTGGNTGSCTDSLSNCQLYGQDMCNNANYAQWARENCARFCNLCMQPGGGSVPSGGSPSGGSFTGSSSGCYYKNQLHQQGQTWQDGCDYECTCTDGTTGKYSCSSLCVTWNLPSACHMNPPASGMCCPTPSCPTGYQIQYPPNYSPK